MKYTVRFGHMTEFPNSVTWKQVVDAPDGFDAWRVCYKG